MRINAYDSATLFRALGDPLRIRLLRLLAQRPLCVCMLVDALAEPQYKVSRNLAILKRAGLVTDRRIGVWIHYSLSPNLSDLASDLLQCITQRCQGGQFAEDDKRLALSHPRTENFRTLLETPTGGHP